MAAIIPSNPWVNDAYLAGDCVRDLDITRDEARMCKAHLQLHPRTSLVDMLRSQQS